MFNAVNILEALKNYIHTRGGTSNAYNIAEAVNDLNSIPQGSGGDIPPEVSNAVETHGMGWTSEEEVSGFDITWDGNTEGLERFETYVKISDLDIPNDQIVGLKYDSSRSDTHEFFRTTEITQEMFEQFIEFETINDDYAILDYFIVIHKDGLVIEEQEIAHKGVYVPDGLHSDLYISRIYKEATTQEVVHQIDQKYIPSSPEVTNAIETHGMGWTSEEEVEGFDILWDGNTEGLESLGGRFFKISDQVYAEDELVGANGEFIMGDIVYKGTVSLFVPEREEADMDFFRYYSISGDVPESFGFDQNIIVILEDAEIEDEGEVISFHKGTYFYGIADVGYTSRLYKEASTKEVVHQIDQKYIPQSSSGVIIETASNTTVGAYQAPNPTAEQVTAAYNAVVSAKPCTLTDALGKQHFVVNQADVVGDAISISILYYMKMIITYSVENDEVVITHYDIGSAE